MKAAFDRSFTPAEVATLYGMPPGTGRGETIALIELGGGYAASDLRAYFGELGLPVPAVNAVSVDGARNAPTGDPNGPDGEVLLDIEVAGAVAPEARIVVYFAPNTDKGFLDAIASAIHDHARTPSVISISWGGPESAWTKQALHAYDQAFQDAAALGVTVCCASGDSGSGDGVEDGRRACGISRRRAPTCSRAVARASKPRPGKSNARACGMQRRAGLRAAV